MANHVLGGSDAGAVAADPSLVDGPELRGRRHSLEQTGDVAGIERAANGRAFTHSTEE
jgi:hypothetical protein